MRAARDLQVVVDEADARRTRPSITTAIQTYGLVRSAQSSVGTIAAARISRPPIVGVPALGRWLAGPSGRITWPNWKLLQPPDQHRPDDQADQHRGDAGGGGAERDVAGHVERAEPRRRVVQPEEQVVEHQRAPSAQAIDDALEADAARALDQHEIAGPDQAGHDLRRFVARSRRGGRRRRRGRRPARRARARGPRRRRPSPGRRRRRGRRRARPARAAPRPRGRARASRRGRRRGVRRRSRRRARRARARPRAGWRCRRRR